MQTILSELSVTSVSRALSAQAQQLAQQLSLSFAQTNEAETKLVVTEHGLELRSTDLGNPIWIDFTAGHNDHRRRFGGGKNQPLAKAIGLKKVASPRVIDTTAGYGRDAFVLASLGCSVTLLERHPIMACLLQDAIIRGQETAHVAEICQRMTLIQCDACDYLSATTIQADAVYLDPMYPSRNKSALVKKEMQLLHQMVGPDTDSEQLFAAARASNTKRVVVKRPKSAPELANISPSSSIMSKNTRYDLYL